MATATHTSRASRGTSLACKGSPQKAALRMLMNTLDPDAAERLEDCVVDGALAAVGREGIRLPMREERAC